jgi:hypothetical protein
LGKREIAEVFVVEVTSWVVGNNVPPHESRRKPVLALTDLELEAVLERVR